MCVHAHYSHMSVERAVSVANSRSLATRERADLRAACCVQFDRIMQFNNVTRCEHSRPLCKINITGVVGQMATRWWWLWSMMSSGSSRERNGRLTTCACVRACVRGIRSTRVGSREQLTLLSGLMCAMLDACGVFKITAQASERASVFPTSSCFKTPRMRVHAHGCHVSRKGNKTARCTVQRFELKPLCDGNKAPAHARQHQKKDRNTGMSL
jgi:hypothetical protein